MATAKDLANSIREAMAGGGSPSTKLDRIVDCCQEHWGEEKKAAAAPKAPAPSAPKPPRRRTPIGRDA
jgi:hypothetical protein